MNQFDQLEKWLSGEIEKLEDVILNGTSDCDKIKLNKHARIVLTRVSEFVTKVREGSVKPEDFR